MSTMVNISLIHSVDDDGDGDGDNGDSWKLIKLILSSHCVRLEL